LASVNKFWGKNALALRPMPIVYEHCEIIYIKNKMCVNRYIHLLRKILRRAAHLWPSMGKLDWQASKDTWGLISNQRSRNSILHLKEDTVNVHPLWSIYNLKFVRGLKPSSLFGVRVKLDSLSGVWGTGCSRGPFNAMPLHCQEHERSTIVFVCNERWCQKPIASILKDGVRIPEYPVGRCHGGAYFFGQWVVLGLANPFRFHRLQRRLIQWVEWPVARMGGWWRGDGPWSHVLSIRQKGSIFGNFQMMRQCIKILCDENF